MSLFVENTIIVCKTLYYLIKVLFSNPYFIISVSIFFILYYGLINKVYKFLISKD